MGFSAKLSFLCITQQRLTAKSQLGILLKFFTSNVPNYRPNNNEWSNVFSRNSQLLNPVQFSEWILLHQPREKNLAGQFVEFLYRYGPQVGMNIAPVRLATVNNDKVESYVSALKSHLTPKVQLVVILTPNLREDRYSAIKKICCVERPVASQVILTKNLINKLNVVGPKIALQMNCKLGGTLWGIHIPYKHIMVCGIDSYHATGGLRVSGSSVGAFVASMDPSCTRWYSLVDFQGRTVEFMNTLTSFMSLALQQYFSTTGHYPDRVIIFRDGVGDNQLQMCREYEIPQIYAGFQTINPDYKPQLTFLVCQKRINTRLYLLNDGHHENPEPGTVVDTQVTHRNQFDFYLISQKVRQGTVSPTHYIVVHNESTMTPDQIQRFTYKMTFLYYNWAGTVRVPAPCQYAHKLAQMVGQNLRTQPSERLRDKLYYL